MKSLQTTDNRRQTTDDGRQVMAIVHLDLWSRCTNKSINIVYLLMDSDSYFNNANYVIKIHKNKGLIYLRKGATCVTMETDKYSYLA